MILGDLVKVPQLNLRQFPATPISPAREGYQYTIGDLHANAVKLAHFLCMHGIMTLSSKQYYELVALYGVNKPTKADLMKFKEILSQATFNISALVRLIGDELADRGQNDLYVLLLIYFLKKAGAKLEIILSNHGVEFLKALERGFQFGKSVLEGEHAQSMFGLQELIDSGLIDKSELQDLVEAYKSSLKLLSYSLNDAEDEITLFTHAATDVRIVSYLGKKYGIQVNDDTPVELARSIERINEFFAKHVSQGTANGLVDDRILHRGYEGLPIDPEKYPLEFMLWNREYDQLDRSPKYKGYKINYAHGHDASEDSHDNVVNLDNLLGKLWIEKYIIEDYEILCSKAHALAPQQSAVEQKQAAAPTPAPAEEMAKQVPPPAQENKSERRIRRPEPMSRLPKPAKIESAETAVKSQAPTLTPAADGQAKPFERRRIARRDTIISKRSATKPVALSDAEEAARGENSLERDMSERWAKLSYENLPTQVRDILTLWLKDRTKSPAERWNSASSSDKVEYCYLAIMRIKKEAQAKAQLPKEEKPTSQLKSTEKRLTRRETYIPRRDAAPQPSPSFSTDQNIDSGIEQERAQLPTKEQSAKKPEGSRTYLPRQQTIRRHEPQSVTTAVTEKSSEKTAVPTPFTATVTLVEPENHAHRVARAAGDVVQETLVKHWSLRHFNSLPGHARTAIGGALSKDAGTTQKTPAEIWDGAEAAIKEDLYRKYLKAH